MYVSREIHTRQRCCTVCTNFGCLCHIAHTAGVHIPNSNLTANSAAWLVWLGGVVVRALDLRLEVADSIPAAALSSATLDKLFTHIVQRL